MKDFNNSVNNTIAKVFLSINNATAGASINCSLKITLGTFGLQKGGSIKVLFRAISDMGTPQFSDPKADNYVKITAADSKAVLIPENSTTGIHHKLHERPWWKGMILTLLNKSLDPETQIILKFKNWRVQTFVEDKWELKIFIDPWGIGRFSEIHNSPLISIKAGKPRKLTVITSTLAETNKSVPVFVRVDDTWGNPCIKQDGNCQIIWQTKDGTKIKTANVRKGRSITHIKGDKKTKFVKAVFKKISATSNPLVFKKKCERNLFWADLHGQSEETVGVKSNTNEDFFRAARDYGRLDVASHQGNDFQLSNAFVKIINKLSRKFNKNGNFVVIPGYEWSGNVSLGGDRNVFFENEQEEIFRSSNALIKDGKTKNIAATVTDLYAKLEGKAIVAAHSGGRKANLNFHNKKLEKLVEVYSAWGNSEELFFEALEKNYKVGIMANSDGHTGRPGFEMPTRDLFPQKGGLTCILANNLTRNEIFNSLKNRHCYATSGHRPFIDFCIKDQKGKKWIMGDELNLKKKNTLKFFIKIVGTDGLKSVELFDRSTIKKKWRSNKLNKNEFALSGNLSFENSEHALFLRVIQKDKEIGWTSPIFISITKSSKIVK